MEKLTKKEQNKLHRLMRHKHGNIKRICDEIEVSDNTLKTAVKGNPISIPIYNKIKNKLESL